MELQNFHLLGIDKLVINCLETPVFQPEASPSKILALLSNYIGKETKELLSFNPNRKYTDRKTTTLSYSPLLNKNNLVIEMFSDIGLQFCSTFQRFDHFIAVTIFTVGEQATFTKPRTKDKGTQRRGLQYSFSLGDTGSQSSVVSTRLWFSYTSCPKH